ncbi:MAG: 4-(cytidine 5'-diphospho)-2-C-methyl-D-erythritol kinase, partial [Spirochaetaceae bacterium]|nr:4-(cytidine 5'-diphospho)-2-C-methyl-D-erythritol kinase [Spirochaetaceae bacterium]
MGKALCVEAPCKINVHLRVKDRRSDGFHDLESVFLALSWGDTLRVELVDGEPGDEIRLDAKIPLGEPLPPGRNIIRRAAALFRDRTGFKGALRFTLEKRVPLGAGLGGGSSDGASALLALNALTGAGLSGEVLRGMAERLGSDVPFFLSGGAALVTGRGERIRNIEPPRDIRVVLVNPGFSSGTAEAFRLLDRYREAPD